MEQRVLLISEVAILLRIAPVTVYRHLAQSRQGIGLFPLPISANGGKLRWNADDIERYIQSQSNIAPPNVGNPVQLKKTFEQRQIAAQRVLDRHRKQKI